MEEAITRLWEHLGDRVGGPMSFRLIMQPAMAAIIGVVDGLRFAREGRSFLLWGGPKDSDERRAQRNATMMAIGKVLLLAIILDLVYQFIVQSGFYFGEAVLVAAFVALVPYFVVRFLVNYGVRALRRSPPPDQSRGSQ